MATTAEYMEFVLEQLRDYPGIRHRKMFGEYMIYQNDKPVLLVCDNTIMVKKLPELARLLENAPCGFPYEGAKEHYILDIEDADTLRQALSILEAVVPEKKKRKKAARQPDLLQAPAEGDGIRTKQ